MIGPSGDRGAEPGTWTLEEETPTIGELCYEWNPGGGVVRRTVDEDEGLSSPNLEHANRGGRGLDVDAVLADFDPVLCIELLLRFSIWTFVRSSHLTISMQLCLPGYLSTVKLTRQVASQPGQRAKTTDNSYHHGDLRRALLETTLEIIDKEGLEAVSLRAVARQLGVSEAAPYHHFASKQDLLAVLTADAYRGLGERLTRAVGSNALEPFERLRLLLHAYIEYGLENRGRYRLMFGEHMIGLGDYLRAHGHDLGPSSRQMLRGAVADCVGDNEEAGAIENIAWSLSHGITGLINEAEIRLPSRQDTQHLIEVGISILIAGIRSYAPRRPNSPIG